MRRRGPLLAAWVGTLVLTLAALAGCTTPTSPAADGPARPGDAANTAAPAFSADDPVDHVVAVSVDGLNPRAITQLGPSGAPAFHRMMREGAGTVNARTEQSLTTTLPNHTGMLTGRRVDPRTGGHGVTVNSDTGTTVHQTAGYYVASVFDVVHDHGGSTAMYAAKTKFALFARTWNANGARDTVGADDGRAKISTVVLDHDNARLVSQLTTSLKRSPPTFAFLHISLPDAAGHAHGFLGPEYLDAVHQTDRLLGQVLTTVAGQPTLRQHLLVLVTADHGGTGDSHSSSTSLPNYRIPFLAWGPGVPAGRDLYAMNPTFRDPSTARPGSAGKQPIRNGDVANLVTDVLDLPAVPGAQLNAQRTLDLFGS